MLGAVRPEVACRARTATGQLNALTFPSIRTDKDVSRLAQEVFALPGRIAEARHRKLAVALDEFQAIGSFDGGNVEHALRAAVQQQRQVGYVFSGSEPSLMERMLGRTRPFYKAGPVMRLQKIPADRFADFIEARFRATKLRPSPGLGASIVELAGNLPYDVQRLAHEVWDDVRGGKTVGLEDLHATLKRLLGEHEAIFEGTWQRLTLAQRAALRTAVLEEGRELLSADVRARKLAVAVVRRPPRSFATRLREGSRPSTFAPGSVPLYLVPGSGFGVRGSGSGFGVHRFRWSGSGFRSSFAVKVPGFVAGYGLRS